MKLLKYKGYSGLAEVDVEAGVIHGSVIGTRDAITFEAERPCDVEGAFRQSIDDYLDFCLEKGKNPDKPYSGRLILRMPPEIHRKLEAMARERSSSINSLAVSLLEKELA